MEPVYFDQLFKKNNRGNYIQRDKALPIDWRHHYRIIGLWLKNHPFVSVYSGPEPGGYSRAAQEEAFWFGPLGGGRWGTSNSIGMRQVSW